MKKISWALILIAAISGSINASSGLLDQLALKYHTDKGSWFHYYTRYYEQYFEPIRHQALKMLEIGFAKGASAYMWEEYFPSAQLYFMDVDSSLFSRHGSKLSSRCHTHQVDQGNAWALLEFISRVGGEFDIIIDDGSHKSQDQKVTFEILFPYVKSGGIYIVEDLHMSYMANHGGTGDRQNPKTADGSITYFLQGLVDSLNHMGAMTECGDENKFPENLKGTLSYYQKNIKAIHFYMSLCFILKR